MHVFHALRNKSKSLNASRSCINVSKNRQVGLIIDKWGMEGVGLYRGETATIVSLPSSIYRKPFAEWNVNTSFSFFIKAERRSLAITFQS